MILCEIKKWTQMPPSDTDRILKMPRTTRQQVYTSETNRQREIKITLKVDTHAGNNVEKNA
jgi:hypothetical protein